jgi:hypothetical protein
MSFADTLAEDRRQIILAALDRADNYTLNDLILQSALKRMGHAVGRDIIRADLAWLTQHGLLRAERIDGGDQVSPSMWLATLTEPGQDVAKGRYHPGIARTPAA